MATLTALSPGVLAKYQPMIGLEVQVQLLTQSKAFCGCVNRYGGEPNTHRCPTCLGLPGALPVLNRRAVEFAVLAAKTIHCEIRETSVFARKTTFTRKIRTGTRSRSSISPSRRTGGWRCRRGWQLRGEEADRRDAAPYGRGRFSIDGIGRVGLLAYPESYLDEQSPSIDEKTVLLVKPERFLLKGTKLATVERFLSKSQPDIRVRI